MTEMWDRDQTCRHNSQYQVNTGWLLVGWNKNGEKIYLSIDPENGARRRNYRTYTNLILKEGKQQINTWVSWLTDVKDDWNSCRHAMDKAHEEAFPEQYEDGVLMRTRQGEEKGPVPRKHPGKTITPGESMSNTLERRLVTSRSLRASNRKSYEADEMMIDDEESESDPEPQSDHPEVEASSTEKLVPIETRGGLVHRDSPSEDESESEQMSRGRQQIVELLQSWETDTELPDDHPMTFLRPSAQW